MSINAALSLLPELNLEAQNTAQEEQLLKRLADWASRFTSFVTIEPPNVLLLEIAGSKRLFDGVGAIRAQVAQGLCAQGLTAHLAIAPTPLASIWLARAGRERCVEDASKLSSVLGALPVACLAWSPSILSKLRGMGVRSIGDCLRLPRPGFARRFGTSLLLELDRAVGRLPDPRESYRQPEQFCADREFDEEQDDRELLLHVCHELLENLAAFLRVRQQQIQRVQFQFFHLKDKATRLMLGRVQAGQTAAHWLELLRIRLERTELAAPVIAVRLRGAQGETAALRTRGLLGDGCAGTQAMAITGLVERLSARMGDTAVYGLDTVAEHRPQHAWRPAGLLDDVPRCATVSQAWNAHNMPQLLHELQRESSLLLRRPLWLLDEPEALATHKGRPLHRGALTLLDGPERLESGWWDDEGIARDYFVASTNDGLRLWIYRDRHGDRWYLHGLFG